VMRDLTHEQASEMLAEAALDALPADEQAAVVAHAAACQECALALAALRDATAQLAYAVPSMADDAARRARVRTRLLARARADLAVADVDGVAAGSAAGRPEAQPPADASAGGRGQGSAEPGSRGVRIGRREPPRSWTASPRTAWAVAGLIAVAAAVLVGVLYTRAADDALQIAHSRAADSLRIAQLEDSLSVQDSTLRELTGKQVSVMQLTSGAQRAPWAWMFWNHATNHWTFVAHNLPAPPAGRTYQLWLVTPKAKISAGTFTPHPDGSAALQATYAVPKDSLRAIAVTEEPAGGVPQPTGPFVITATAGE
jgi:anti-sigma-K factor RskA